MNSRKILKNSFYFLVLLCFFGAIFWTSYILYGGLENFIIKKVNPHQNTLLLSLANSVVLPKKTLTKKSNATDFQTQAESAIAVNFSDQKPQILFEKNKNKVLPIASITKLMTALLVMENYNQYEKVKIPVNTQFKEPTLKTGDEFYVKDLLKIMLVESDNTAALALANAVGQNEFVALMNARAKELDMNNTIYDNSIGIGPNCKSNTQDLVILAEYILKNNPEIFEISKIQDFDLFDTQNILKRKAKNINRLLFDDSKEFKNKIIGGKTGSNPYAGECLLLVIKSFNKNNYLIIVVINAGPKDDDRFLETKNIINWIKNSYTWN